MELYPVKSKNSNKPLGIDFFNSFIVTNWRHCVLKLLVLVKVPTPIKTSSTSLIESFLLSSRTIVDIYSDI